jgi:streptogramin lyase
LLVPISAAPRSILKAAALVALLSGTAGASYRLPPAFSPHLTIFQGLPGGSGSFGIVAGPDGNMWYTQCGSIVRMSFTGRQVAFPIPSGACGASIVRGPNRTLWFSESTIKPLTVGKITLDGAVTEYVLPASGLLTAIAEGPDESLWFGTWYGGIGQITTRGKITMYDAGDPDLVNDITFGPDGNLWFVENQTGEIAYMRPDHTIVERKFVSPTWAAVALTTGPDDNLWISEPYHGYSKIIRYEQRTGQRQSWFFADGECDAIVSGDDRALYFTYIGSDVGRITLSGHHDLIPLPNGFTPRSIARGPDGSIWFPDAESPRIGRLTP